MKTDNATAPAVGCSALLGNLSSLIKKYDEQKTACRKYWRDNIEGRRVEETYAEGRWHYQMEEEAEETLANLLKVAREISLLPNVQEEPRR